MESRKSIWKSVGESPEVKLYIDARMGLQTLVVWSVMPPIKAHKVAYSQSICADSVTLPEPCTARTVGYTPLMAASVVSRLTKAFVNQEQIPQQVVLDLATYTLMTL